MSQDIYAGPSDTAEGRVFTVTGQDWDTITQSLGEEGIDERVVVHRGEITFHVRREDLPAVARMLRDDELLRFEFCSGVSGVHYPDDTGHELHAVYHLLSMTHNRRIRLEVAVPDGDAHLRA